MNKERIKELIDKATIWEGMIDGYIFDKEKFAELIVKKCASPTAYNALAEHWEVEE